MFPALNNWTANVPSIFDWRWLSLFQINRGDDESTEDATRNPDTPNEMLAPQNESSQKYSAFSKSRLLESALIFLAFALYAGQLPPDVNESHYLTKAKHFWNPDWIAGDIFLGSSFSHWLFYATTGWLTRIAPFAAVAWIGRLVTWALIAFAWQRLSWKLFQVRWFGVFSAILFAILNERFHLAGEWVVGGFEAKGLAYFFVLMALGNIATQSWKTVWPMLGLASAFHVLVGGWSVIAALFAWAGASWIELDGKPHFFSKIRNRIGKQIVPLCIGGFISLAGILPPVLADWNTDPEVASAAQLIYVNQRIAHHLTFDAFPTIYVARFTLVVLFWIVLHRWLKRQWLAGYHKLYPLFLFGLGSLLISFVGLLLSGLGEQGGAYSERCTTLLRFYWFRLSDFAIPATTAISTTALVWYWLNIKKNAGTSVSTWTFVLCIVAAFFVMCFDRHEDPRPRADRRSLPAYEDNKERTQATYRNWRKVCQWIAENTEEDATFITPAQQQTFKWYAQRREVFCWKDIPQDADGILIWDERRQQLYKRQRGYEAGLLVYTDDGVRQIAKTYGADYLVIPQRCLDVAGNTSLKQVYPENPYEKSTYVILKLTE